ncbi:MAG: hypothetical protein LKJ17_05990 [Oscillospiraceae bacterium]|jgi:hypothetical protein|nr:hypothetical protein [Oscillospiraceae bacterium]
MTDEKNYCEEIHPVSCAGTLVTVRNLTPVYSAQERQKIREEINQTLYEVFSKYP